MQTSLKLENSGPFIDIAPLLIKRGSILLNLFFTDTMMDLTNTATQEETLLTPRNQQMVVGQNLQLPPNHLFDDNSQLVVGVSPHTPWLDTIKEQNAQLVTGRVSPTAYSPTNSGEETRQTTVVPTTTCVQDYPS